MAGANNPGEVRWAIFLGAGMGMALGQQMGGAVAGPRQAGLSPAAAPPPLPTATQYHVEQNGQAGGPYTAAQLPQYIAGGAVTRQTALWAANMAGWTAAGQVPELSLPFLAVPPLLGCLWPDRARVLSRRLFRGLSDDHFHAAAAAVRRPAAAAVRRPPPPPFGAPPPFQSGGPVAVATGGPPRPPYGRTASATTDWCR